MQYHLPPNAYKVEQLSANGTIFNKNMSEKRRFPLTREPSARDSTPTDGLGASQRARNCSTDKIIPNKEFKKKISFNILIKAITNCF